jgi:hypothetical protein
MLPSCRVASTSLFKTLSSRFCGNPVTVFDGADFALVAKYPQPPVTTRQVDSVERLYYSSGFQVVRFVAVDIVFSMSNLYWSVNCKCPLTCAHQSDVTGNGLGGRPRVGSDFGAKLVAVNTPPAEPFPPRGEIKPLFLTRSALSHIWHVDHSSSCTDTRQRFLSPDLDVWQGTQPLRY